MKGMILMPKTVKTRKVAKTTVITVPSELNVPTDIQFEPSINEHGDIIFKRIDQLKPKEVTNITEFVDQFKPVLEYLKDR
ncbi:hypothetical protein [Pediococcus cellicola]